MYFSFEPFGLIFLAAVRVCVVVPGMVLTMQTKIQSCNMKGILKMLDCSYNINVLIQVQFRSHMT